jgi:hypothetical protein
MPLYSQRAVSKGRDLPFLECGGPPPLFRNCNIRRGGAQNAATSPCRAARGSSSDEVNSRRYVLGRVAACTKRSACDSSVCDLPFLERGGPPALFRNCNFRRGGAQNTATSPRPAARDSSSHEVNSSRYVLGRVPACTKRSECDSSVCEGSGFAFLECGGPPPLFRNCNFRRGGAQNTAASCRRAPHSSRVVCAKGRSFLVLSRFTSDFSPGFSTLFPIRESSYCYC